MLLAKTILYMPAGLKNAHISETAAYADPITRAHALTMATCDVTFPVSPLLPELHFALIKCCGGQGHPFA